MRTRCLLAAALLSWSVLPAHAEEGPPTTSPGVPAGAAVLIQPVSSNPRTRASASLCGCVT